MEIYQYLFIWEHIIDLTLITMLEKTFILHSRQVIGKLVLSLCAVLPNKMKSLQQQYHLICHGFASFYAIKYLNIELYVCSVVISTKKLNWVEYLVMPLL